VIIDGAAGGETFPLLTCTAEKIVYIFLQDFSEKRTLSMPVSCRFFIRITEEILRTLHLMHDGISFGKILPK
jgi:hypothetical protein